MSEVTAILSWQHPVTGKLHLWNRCLAVRFHRATMAEVEIQCTRGAGYEWIPVTDDQLCPFCFPAGRAVEPQLDR